MAPVQALAFLTLTILGLGRARYLGRERKPAQQAVQQLDAVEQALRKVEGAKLSPEQKKASSKAVQDIEHVLAELEGNKKLSKAQRLAKVKAAIEELQGLQSQWQLASVEESLKKAAQSPHLSAKQAASAKKVVADVDEVVDEIRAGRLEDKAARNRKVSLAIQELEALQQEWVNASSASHIAKLKQELAEKKALLAKDQKELKLAGLQKELLEKKAELQRMIEEKREAEAHQKEGQQEAAQHEMVGNLLASVQAIYANQTSSGKGGSHAGSKGGIATSRSGGPSDGKEVAKQAAIKAIVSSLQAQAKNISQSIARMDAEQKKHEQELQAPNAPTAGKTDAIAKGQALLKSLLKRSRRTYQKARAAREVELKELNEGIRSVEKGDVKALAHLMSKMEGESKSLQAKAKNFLY